MLPENPSVHREGSGAPENVSHFGLIELSSSSVNFECKPISETQSDIMTIISELQLHQEIAALLGMCATHAEHPSDGTPKPMFNRSRGFSLFISIPCLAFVGSGASRNLSDVPAQRDGAARPIFCNPEITSLLSQSLSKPITLIRETPVSQRRDQACGATGAGRMIRYEAVCSQ